MSVNKLTITQLIVACGLSRNIPRREICRVANCTASYITRLMHEVEFMRLIDMFSNLPVDPDTKMYKGLGTLMQDVGRFIYNHGEKITRDEK